MVTYRSARLERLLGAPVAEAQHSHVLGLIAGAVPEDFDLDYKRELYGNGGSDRRSLCSDVAAMANTAGGLIILGMDEDAHGVAATAPEVDLSDDEKRRMLQIIASGVSPLPQFDVIPIPGGNPDRGFYLISVLRSPEAPHAVIVNNETLRFPRRNGSTTVYLTQAEVRAAYLAQFTADGDRAGRIVGLDSALTVDLDVSEQTYLVVSLLPDLGGSMNIDTAALQTFQQQVAGRSPFIVGYNGSRWTRGQVGPGCLTANGSSNPGDKAKWLACHLHKSGAGVFASAFDRGMPNPMSSAYADGPLTNVGDELLAESLLAGLRFLAAHARDRSGASGNALLRASIFPVADEVPARLIQYRAYSGGDEYGTRRVTVPPSATTVADIDDLAAEGPELVAAAYRLGSELFQAFGIAEIPQMTAAGEFRQRYWLSQARPTVEAWAKKNGVSMIDEKI
ncbi:helix-turn-helix domain-containing protein [Streptomyces sp. NPDC088354]|uniref:AlbA family DNA-binding domain-containing protein n=1 Tax=Streptomyces sp. NPDC088354 TaxID=3365856 RepID=UPI00381E49E0